MNFTANLICNLNALTTSVNINVTLVSKERVRELIECFPWELLFTVNNFTLYNSFLYCCPVVGTHHTGNFISVLLSEYNIQEDLVPLVENKLIT